MTVQIESLRLTVPGHIVRRPSPKNPENTEIVLNVDQCKALYVALSLVANLFDPQPEVKVTGIRIGEPTEKKS